jgi:hypothetical protein
MRLPSDDTSIAARTCHSSHILVSPGFLPRRLVTTADTR